MNEDKNAHYYLLTKKNKDIKNFFLGKACLLIFNKRNSFYLHTFRRAIYEGRLLTNFCFDLTYDIKFACVVIAKSPKNDQQIKNLTFPRFIAFCVKNRT